MSYQAKIKRYLNILQQIDQQRFPSIAELICRISDSGINVSERQLKRDIESLRDEFGVDIRYSAHNRGYYLEAREMTFPYFVKLLEFSENTELLRDCLKKGLDISEIMDFEDFNSFKGMEYLQVLSQSIYNQKEIRLYYKRFDADEEKNYLFHPYLLREYLNRWYVIGYLSDTSEIRTFGLDRIIGLHDSGKKFKKNKNNDIAILFQNVIGINASKDEKPQEIELICNSFQGNLLKSLPLHASQRVIRETNDSIVLTFNMVINFELKQRLLMMSTQAKVVKPVRLKNEIEEMLFEALNFYKN